ncbi:hypothetical protein ABN034_05315 [Actinopolymorpha sp. B11F2]|uniref:hypothetical protein n=1 Tax=Actinopolymorpha sp. B11F2 TaxID=3160862 RepID=UPI0032E3A055
MVTSESRLRGALDLLFTDGPVLDVYSHGPWAVPDGLLDEAAARIDTLVADRRSAQLTLGKQPGLRTPTPAVVADVLGMVAFLCGDAAVRAGVCRRVEHDLVERFRIHPVIEAEPDRRWVAQGSSWRPPGRNLFQAAGDDRARRTVALDLTTEALQALDGVVPLNERRQALLHLYDEARRDADLLEATLTTPYVRSEWGRLEERWAELAGDDLVAILPELTGPVGYLSWIVDGWIAAHERLGTLVPGGGDSTQAFVSLLIQAGMTEAPAELAVGVRGELYSQVQQQLRVVLRTWNAGAWRRRVRDWLARALVAGELELSRAWLDLSVRLTGAVQGLPGAPATPRPCLVPVDCFQEDVRRLFRVRRVRHPLTGSSSVAGWVAADAAFPFGVQAGGRLPEEEFAGESLGSGPSPEERPGDEVAVEPAAGERARTQESAAASAPQEAGARDPATREAAVRESASDQPMSEGAGARRDRAAAERASLDPAPVEPGRVEPDLVEQAQGDAPGEPVEADRTGASRADGSAAEGHPTGADPDQITAGHDLPEHPDHTAASERPARPDQAASATPATQPDQPARAGQEGEAGVPARAGQVTPPEQPTRPEQQGEAGQTASSDPAAADAAAGSPPSDIAQPERSTREPAQSERGRRAVADRLSIAESEAGASSVPPEQITGAHAKPMPPEGGDATTAFSQQMLGLIGPSTPPQGRRANESGRDHADTGPHGASHGAGSEHEQHTSSEAVAGTWGFEAFASHGQHPDSPGPDHQRNGGRIPADRSADPIHPHAGGQGSGGQGSGGQGSGGQGSGGQGSGGQGSGGQGTAGHGGAWVSGGHGGYGGTAGRGAPASQGGPDVHSGPGVQSGPGDQLGYGAQRGSGSQAGSGGPAFPAPVAPPASLVGSPSNDFAWYNATPPGDYREPVEAESEPGDYAMWTRREPTGPRAQVLALIDSIVGQPALVTALREAVAAPEQDLRLLVAGPPGTGEGMTVDVLSKLVTARGFDGTAITIRYEHLARLDPTTAVGQLREWVDGCLGERLLAIEDLDQIISDGARGAALAEELHRLISICGTDLQVVVFTGPDGYRRLVDINPALAAWWRVVRTRDFDAGDYATIFGRVVEQRGAVATDDAARRAGDMLAATPAEGQLRNARLAAYLAEMAIDAARRRTDGSSPPMVDLADLPRFESEPPPPQHVADGPQPGAYSRLGRLR